MIALGLTVKPPSDLFQLPLDEYMKERESRCRESLKILGLYDRNRDLAPMVMGMWYRDYWEHKARSL